jgi:hypothetical protein
MGLHRAGTFPVSDSRRKLSVALYILDQCNNNNERTIICKFSLQSILTVTPLLCRDLLCRSPARCWPERLSIIPSHTGLLFVRNNNYGKFNK